MFHVWRLSSLFLIHYFILLNSLSKCNVNIAHDQYNNQDKNDKRGIKNNYIGIPDISMLSSLLLKWWILLEL